MASRYSSKTDIDVIKKIATRTLQSGNVAFLIGSGASAPAIPIASGIEEELNKLYAAGEGKQTELAKRTFEFVSSIQVCTNALVERTETGDTEATLNQYREFLNFIARLLEERKTNLLSKQVTVFSTNYDLFIERASEDIANLQLNDGFDRTPVLSSKFPFRPEHFFDVTYRTGNLFNYQFPAPSVNLIKLHGSLSWAIEGKELMHRTAKRKIPKDGDKDFANAMGTFLGEFSLILPTKAKFHQTLMDRIYYDLMRIFANALEIENTVLFAFGFSFEDEHIRDITQRALKNPTLLIFVFAHSANAAAGFEEKFAKYNNVLIIAPDDGETIEFEQFNALLSSMIPSSQA